jgi:hypothetical protein
VVNHRETMYINSELLISALCRASKCQAPGRTVQCVVSGNFVHS